MKILKIFVIACVVFMACDDNSTKPEIEQVVNDTTKVIIDTTQINIVWSSLADTPWPMYHHDPQSTGRSQYSGPSSGLVESIKFDNCRMTMSGISIGYDNTAFLPTGDFSNTLIAFDFDGNIKWERNNNSTSTALIRRDSSICIPTVYNTFTTYNHHGDTIWNSQINKMYNLGLNIDLDGIIYFVDFMGNGDYTGILKVFDSNGKLLWSLKDNLFLGSPDAIPSFSPDGRTLYVQGVSVSLIAVDITTKSIKWTFGSKTLLSAPVVDNEGNIFIKPGEFSSSSTSLYSLNSEGTINWEFKLNSGILFDNTEPTIDWNGNIYFGQDTLYSLTNAGKLRWKRGLGADITSALVSDINNTIYFGTSDEKIFSFYEDGRLRWMTENLEFRTIGACPAITNDGKLLFPSWRNSNVSFSIIK